MKKLLGLFFVLAAAPAFAQFFPITTGAVPFGDSRRNLRSDATNLFWDNTNKQLELGDGTSSLPAFSFISDTDTGMFRVSSNRLGLSLGGNRHLSLNVSGTAGTVLQLRNSGADVAQIGTDAGDSLIRLLPNSTTASSSYYSVHGPSHATLANIHLWFVAGTESARLSSNGLQVVGASSNTPTDVSVTADNQAVTVGNTSYLRITSDNATPANRTITLSAGVADGQVVRLAIVTNSVELADSGNVALSAAWTPDTNDTLTLMWDATNTLWREMGRSAN